MDMEVNVLCGVGGRGKKNMKGIRCPVCKIEKLDIRKDKNGKPYVICNPCSMQMFVRGNEGMKNLKKLIISGGPVSQFKEVDFPKEHIE